MPRYSVILTSTTDPRAKVARYVWADDLDAAKDWARNRLGVIRQVAHDRSKWDRWTVKAKLSPHREPETVASGGPED